MNEKLTPVVGRELVWLAATGGWNAGTAHRGVNETGLTFAVSVLCVQFCWYG